MDKICPFLGTFQTTIGGRRPNPCRKNDCALWFGEAEKGECSFRRMTAAVCRPFTGDPLKIIESGKPIPPSRLRTEMTKEGDQETATWIRARTPAKPKKSFTPDEETRARGGSGLNSFGLPPSEAEAWMKTAAKNTGKLFEADRDAVQEAREEIKIERETEDAFRDGPDDVVGPDLPEPAESTQDRKCRCTLVSQKDKTDPRD